MAQGFSEPYLVRGTSRVSGLKVFISVDLEGMPHVVIPGHLALKGALYEEARKIATRTVAVVLEELNREGVEHVVVADSHGPMVNLLVDDLPDYVELVRGYPRPVSMMSGIQGCDAAIFLGYHAKAGTALSTFDHTYYGSVIHRVEVNGIEASEFLLNTYVAGEFNVPVIMVAGEAQLLEDDVKVHTPWAERVTLKRSLSRAAAVSFGMGHISNELRESLKRAIDAHTAGRTRPLLAKTPVQIDVTMNSTYFADSAELMPGVTRIDGLHIRYTSPSMNEAYRVLELLCLAATGVSAIREKQS